MNESLEEGDIRIQCVELSSSVADELIGALNAELSRQYPEEGATHFRLDAEEVTAGQGAFLVVWRGSTPIGCGAVRRIASPEGDPRAQVGELKRMYVKAEERGRGVGRMLLQALETEARALGLSRLVLETGVRQGAALALYRSAGFTPIAAFGEYVGSPLSVCMGKQL